MRSDTLRMTMLLDFYGELLTEKQHEYYALYYNEDLSLTEIAKMKGISKQGAHDIITRARDKLIKIERKTGIVNKWCDARSKIELAQKSGVKMQPDVLDYFHIENCEL